MKKRFSGPQIVAKLRQADILIGKGLFYTRRELDRFMERMTRE
ncbi:MAG: hypothetical protein ACYS80_18465 [Planctomycetota bacterium]|jgi:hypothetical protein